MKEQRLEFENIPAYTEMIIHGQNPEGDGDVNL